MYFAQGKSCFSKFIVYACVYFDHLMRTCLEPGVSRGNRWLVSERAEPRIHAYLPRKLHCLL